MVYIAIFGALIFLNFSINLKGKVRYSTYVATLLGLFLFSAFRFDVGCDWPGYLDQFLYPKDVWRGDGLTTLSEPLWWLIIHKLRDFDAAYPWLNVVSSVIFFAGVHALARRQPDPLAFLVVLFPVLIINMPMSGIRQAAAIGMICFALTAFMDRRLVRFVGFVAIASALHSSAIIFLVLTPFVYGQISNFRILAAGLLAIPGAIAVFNSSAATLAMTRYVESDIQSAGAIYRVALLSISGGFFLSLLRSKWRDTSPKDYKLVFVGSVAMVSLVAFVPFSTVISDRVGYYFIPIQAIIFSRIPYLNLGKFQRYFQFGIFFILAVFLVYWTQMSAIFAQCYIPYQSWIFGMPSFSKY